MSAQQAPEKQAPEKKARPVFERMRQLVLALGIAGLLQLLTVVAPLDEVLRLWQYWSARELNATQQASGKIVYVGAETDLSDPAYPERRAELAQVITRLDRAGARQIYVDVVFDRPSTPAADAALHGALAQAGDRVALVETVKTSLNGNDELLRSTPAIGAGVPQVAGHIWTNFMGFAWRMRRDVEVDGQQYPALASHMAGMADEPGGLYPISYYFALPSIPVQRYDQLAATADAPATLAGQTVVIGLLDPPGRTLPNLPGLSGVSPSLIHIFAAETLIAGDTVEIDGLITLLSLALLLGGAGLIPAQLVRRSGYAIACAAVPLAFIITAFAAMRIDAGAALVLALVYGASRLRAIWKRNFRLVDDETNLPTFAALEAARDVADKAPAIIIARIQHFEEVRRTLPRELHADYLLRIIARLSAATQEATIYLGQGHLLAWTMPDKDPALIAEHLTGLRALFSAPLLVGSHTVDVGITFGVDLAPGSNVTRRLAAAVSASERSTETYEPIVFADSASDEDLLWNISLQARIDAALGNGEIFLVYQPKIAVDSGELTGVEALVRWRDPVRGLIPPDRFISQCENAGRMRQLTRHVLGEACRAGNAFERLGQLFPIAVNISATLLHDRDIVRMVDEVLEETGYAPERLVLEITETFRIADFDRASGILAQLSALGCKISMDDFGVGAASLEALQRLGFDEIKIDRTFVSRIVHDAKARGIVSAILHLGRELQLNVVAEGVEDAATLALLRAAGCPVAQGFGISRPVPFDDLVAFQRAPAQERLRMMV